MPLVCGVGPVVFVRLFTYYDVLLVEGDFDGYRCLW